jgi:hypothetical protein
MKGLLWDGGSDLIARSAGYTDKLVKEAIEIRLHANNFNRDSGFMLSQAWHPLINELQRLSDTQMNGSREGKEQEMKRRQVKGPPPRGSDRGRRGATRAADGHCTDNGWLADFFPRQHWLGRSDPKFRWTLLANGYESGSAAIPHWPMAVRGKTSTMYINITSGQLSHHSPDDGGGDGLRNVGPLSTTDTACCPRRFYHTWFRNGLSLWRLRIHAFLVNVWQQLRSVCCVHEWRESRGRVASGADCCTEWVSRPHAPVRSQSPIG